MLTLYHGPAMANGLKPLIALKEKQLPFESRYMDLFTFEQHEPWFLALNPEGQVPVLDHDGTIITDSTMMVEYLDDAFPDSIQMRPDDLADRARMRVWNKYIDEHAMEAVSMHGWHGRIGAFARSIGDEKFETLIERIPLQRQKDKWRTARAGFPEQDLARSRAKVEDAVTRAEEQLGRTEWLAGKTMSLADVNYFANVALSLERLFPGLTGAEHHPHLFAWLRRMQERPSVVAAFAVPPPGM